MIYKITAVGKGPKDWKSSYGAMKEYKIKLKDETDIIRLNQKASTPAPEVGQELVGSIDFTDEFGPKFNKEFTKPEEKKSNYVDHHEDIKSEWAIGQAIIMLNAGKDLPKLEDVEALASDLYSMVERIGKNELDDAVDVTGDEDIQQSLDDIDF